MAIEKMKSVTLSVGPTLSLFSGAYVKASATVTFDPTQVPLEEAKRALRVLYGHALAMETDLIERVEECESAEDVEDVVKHLVSPKKKGKRRG